MRTWIKQKPKAHNCGPIAVAVIAGITLEESIKIIGKKGSTSTKNLANGLRKLGYSCPDRCKKMPRPPLAIAQMKHPGRRSGWHWVVVDGDKIYDGIYGDKNGNVRWPWGGKLTSYLPITRI